MTQDEIIEMAREAGVWTEEDDWFKDTEFEDNWNPKIEAFAKLVAEKEREECANMVDHILREGGGTYGDAIRARGEQA
jgi:hypothetical protein